MDTEQANDGVKLEDRSLRNRSVRNRLLDPALRYPVRHECGDGETSRNWKTLKVLCLARRILWHVSCSDVEAGQSCQARKHEASQQKLVEAGPDAKRESTCSGRYAERDLCIVSPALPVSYVKISYQISQRVELCSHQTALFPHAGDHAVEKVEEKTKGHEAQGGPCMSGVRWGEAVAHRR